MLFAPDELGWVASFTKDLQEKVLKRKWASLLRHAALTNVEVPGYCTCEIVLETAAEHAAAHAEYNTKIRAAIMTSGARLGLFKALHRELTPEQEEECRKSFPLRNGEQLLDFLRATPKPEWFKQPYNAKRMYQGGALKNQASNPGLSN